MESIIIGNGINIQFGEACNLNSAIIYRAIHNIISGNYPRDVYPKETAESLQIFCKEIGNILKGEYDKFALASYEK